MFLVIDENVSQDVMTFLVERGHRVECVKDWLGEGTSDYAVAFAANHEGAIIVTHDKDFKQIVRRAQAGQGQVQGVSFRRLGRVSLQCAPYRASARMRDVIDLIEFEFDRCQGSRDQRIIITVTETTVTTTR